MPYIHTVLLIYFLHASEGSEEIREGFLKKCQLILETGRVDFVEEGKEDQEFESRVMRSMYSLAT